MKLFEGKSPTERNKLIAAIVLGVMCLFVLYFVFGRGLFSGNTTTVTAKVTPKQSASPKTNPDDLRLPPQDEQDREYQTTPIVYNAGSYDAPDPGRNIFAFYEPPPKTPDIPTPEVIKTLIPTPTPWMQIAFVTPQSVYAGAAGFRIEVNGDKFTPETRIYFSQSELPTTFVTAQKLVADVPANFIAGEGPRQIVVQTPDGKMYSNQILLDVQAPPRPQFKYIGMIARTRANNDTAYFEEQGKQTPMTARLNDVVSGRFRLVSISAAETILEDVNLGFRHRLPLTRPEPGSTGSAQPGRGIPGAETYVPYNPGNQNFNGTPQSIPGIPDNIPRYVPTPQPRPQNKKDVDDEDDEDTDGYN